METEQQQAMELEQVPAYKTRTIEPDEVDVLLLVLDESIKIGKTNEFAYSSINDLNHMALQRTSYLDNIIKDKKQLFKRVDQRSYTYNRILQVAKLALRKLQDDGEYNYYSAELICRFVQLEEIFGERKLKSVGVKWIEEQEISIKEKKSAIEQPKIFINEDIGQVNLPSNINGKKLKRYKEKQQEQEQIGEALKEMNFDDEPASADVIKGMEFTN